MKKRKIKKCKLKYKNKSQKMKKLRSKKKTIFKILNSLFFYYKEIKFIFFRHLLIYLIILKRVSHKSKIILLT